MDPAQPIQQVGEGRICARSVQPLYPGLFPVASLPPASYLPSLPPSRIYRWVRQEEVRV